MSLNSESLIQVSNLSKEYKNGVKALKNLNFSIFKGITALVGPNGAGKTTFLKILIGFLRPSFGKCKVLNLDSWKDSLEIRGFLRYLPDGTIFPDNLTVETYVEIIRNLVSYSLNNKIPINLDLSLDQKIGTLSSGMIKKLGLYLTLIGNPTLVLLDEPTANLDPMARRKFFGLIQDLHKEKGISFIISSHVFSDLEKICEHVIAINEGKITFQGSFSELMENFTTNEFEIYSNNPKKWIEICRNIPEIENIENFGNTINITTKKTISSRYFIEIFEKYDVNKELDFEILRKKQSYDALFLD
ncbi:MAG: putative ABC transporter ATP-binding protein YbhF [Candidatus Heimdallarchaeota archaeon LC_3]|nr:MAG: putative ABC transporter ATP-binding protein YbhF [Candidatus Heimdallarchaeota archaeon LC_3]